VPAAPPPSTDTDADLVRRMASGDERALGAFYDRWSGMLSSLLVKMLADADEAEDVLEETFWQAWRQADRYDATRASTATWLTTIARSRALDRLRARRRRGEEPWSAIAEGNESTSSSESLAAPSRDPLANVEAADRRTRVVAALASLPAEQRQAIELAYFGGLSQSEIADRLQQPLGTVKTRVRLAMDKLRERLGVLAEGAR